MIGELSQSVKVALDLYQTKDGERQKLNQEQRELVDHVCRLVCAWLFLPDEAVFVPMSRTELTPQMINGLSRWMSENKDGAWVQRYTFRDELAHVIYWAKLGYDWSVEAAKRGDGFLLADVIERYRTESPFGDGGTVVNDDHWNLHSFADYVEIKTQGDPPPLFPEPPQTNLIDSPSLENHGIRFDEIDELMPPEGAVWCEWCGDVVSAPGKPCPQCEKLGAEEKPKPTCDFFEGLE